VVNQWRYRSRWMLYHDFVRHMEDAGAEVYTIEVAYGDRAFAVTESGNPKHIQMRTRDELWHKENAINLAISRLPADWKKVAWIDADVSFARPDIVEATLHMLEHFQLVQMWGEALDLDPDGHPFARYRSFCQSYLQGAATGKELDKEMDKAMTGYGSGSGGGPYWHSGYAWAARREALNTTGGLLDFAVLGAADFMMAWGLIGRMAEKVYQQIEDRDAARKGYSKDYYESLLRWEERALRLRKNIGCVEGTLLHHWHGKKRQRGYNTREAILIGQSFAPSNDLRRDVQGLWQLHDDGTERFVRLRDQIRSYFRSRNEDSIDL
jgi:hypothetical protein